MGFTYFSVKTKTNWFNSYPNNTNNIQDKFQHQNMVLNNTNQHTSRTQNNNHQLTQITRILFVFISQITNVGCNGRNQLVINPSRLSGLSRHCIQSDTLRGRGGGFQNGLCVAGFGRNPHGDGCGTVSGL